MRSPLVETLINMLFGASVMAAFVLTYLCFAYIRLIHHERKYAKHLKKRQRPILNPNVTFYHPSK